MNNRNMKLTFALGLCTSIYGAFGATIGPRRDFAVRYLPSVAPTPYPAPTKKYSSSAYEGTQPPSTAPTPLPDSYTAPENGKDYAPTQSSTADDVYRDEDTNNMCWMETKKCCYIEEADGYECKDYYENKYSRCYAKFKHVRKCDKAEDHGKPEQPKSRIDRENSIKQYYDKNYGPHVEGYPSGGESVWYDSKDLPKKPYGVQGEPQYQLPSDLPDDISNDSGYVS